MARTHATPDGEVPFTAEEEAAQDALEAKWAAGENDRLAEMARAERNAKLAETDWTALSDVTMADNMKTYRQALRDLPAHKDGKDATLKDGVLENVKWPLKPA